MRVVRVVVVGTRSHTAESQAHGATAVVHAAGTASVTAFLHALNELLAFEFQFLLALFQFALLLLQLLLARRDGLVRGLTACLRGTGTARSVGVGRSRRPGCRGAHHVASHADRTTTAGTVSGTTRTTQHGVRWKRAHGAGVTTARQIHNGLIEGGRGGVHGIAAGSSSKEGVHAHVKAETAAARKEVFHAPSETGHGAAAEKRIAGASKRSLWWRWLLLLLHHHGGGCSGRSSSLGQIHHAVRVGLLSLSLLLLRLLSLSLSLLLLRGHLLLLLLLFLSPTTSWHCGLFPLFCSSGGSSSGSSITFGIAVVVVVAGAANGDAARGGLRIACCRRWLLLVTTIVIRSLLRAAR